MFTYFKTKIDNYECHKYKHREIQDIFSNNINYFILNSLAWLFQVEFNAQFQKNIKSVFIH